MTKAKAVYECCLFLVPWYLITDFKKSLLFKSDGDDANEGDGEITDTLLKNKMIIWK